jgi:hypothetical protein
MGFQKIRWHEPLLSPEGVRQEGQEFWQDFLKYAPIIGIECVK